MVVSFDAFFATSREPLVRAVTMVVGSPSAAADHVDEAMLRAYQQWSKVSTLERPGGWVYRVAINLNRSRLRRLQREAKYRWLNGRPGTSTDDAAFADRLANDRLLGALQQLPVSQRSVVVARVLLDYSEAEVADVLQIQPGTVKSRLSRGLHTLRGRLPDLAPSIAHYAPDQSPDPTHAPQSRKASS